MDRGGGPTRDSTAVTGWQAKLSVNEKADLVQVAESGPTAGGAGVLCVASCSCPLKMNPGHKGPHCGPPGHGPGGHHPPGPGCPPPGHGPGHCPPPPGHGPGHCPPPPGHGPGHCPPPPGHGPGHCPPPPGHGPGPHH
nr:proline, histidine and glycine-rich protein 1 isoform X1 [Peromyscus maniculatus bairdii]